MKTSEFKIVKIGFGIVALGILGVLAGRLAVAWLSFKEKLSGVDEEMYVAFFAVIGLQIAGKIVCTFTPEWFSNSRQLYFSTAFDTAVICCVATFIQLAFVLAIVFYFCACITFNQCLERLSEEVRSNSLRKRVKMLHIVTWVAAIATAALFGYGMYLAGNPLKPGAIVEPILLQVLFVAALGTHVIALLLQLRTMGALAMRL